MGVNILGFSVFALAMVGTPGPANMVLLTAGARYGLRSSLGFVAGITLGKQFIIWPIGFGLMTLSSSAPWLFVTLKWLSAAYILWLAWRIAGSRITPGGAKADAPGFLSGLIVHPLNPKAWAMVTAAFTNFVPEGTSALSATASIALVFACVQLIMHPLWCWSGDRLATLVAGRPAERWVMVTLAGLTVASVIYVIAKDQF